MNDDAFVILDFGSAPPKPAEPPPNPTYRTLSPELMSKLMRGANPPFYLEPVYDTDGPTGQWRIIREAGATERCIGEFDTEDDALIYFQQCVREFHGQR